MDTTRKRITEEHVATVERCAKLLGLKLNDQQWLDAWRLLRDGVKPDLVLSEMGIHASDPRRTAVVGLDDCPNSGGDRSHPDPLW